MVVGGQLQSACWVRQQLNISPLSQWEIVPAKWRTSCNLDPVFALTSADDSAWNLMNDAAYDVTCDTMDDALARARYRSRVHLNHARFVNVAQPFGTVYVIGQPAVVFNLGVGPSRTEITVTYGWSYWRAARKSRGTAADAGALETTILSYVASAVEGQCASADASADRSPAESPTEGADASADRSPAESPTEETESPVDQPKLKGARGGTGIYRSRHGYVARSLGKRRVHLGTFSTEQAATDAIQQYHHSQPHEGMKRPRRRGSPRLMPRSA